jgi:hypothetical protein
VTALAIGIVLLGLSIFCLPLVLLAEGVAQHILEGDRDE